MNAELNTRLRSVLSAHLDHEGGSVFWLDRARSLGITGPEDVPTIRDLHRLGEMTAADLRRRPLMDYIPRSLLGTPERLVIGQTGGTTGAPVWTAYRDDEFRAAFVEPFVAAAKHVGFPQGEPWLFIGPSGPHLIGQAARAIARSVDSAEPFSVDFDPRWARRLAAGSVAAQRYLQHVIDQSMDTLSSQPISVLFATPPVLLKLADTMTIAQRRRVRAVHYGGMAIDEVTLDRLQADAFPDALHLAGYGNTLLGCCLELNTLRGRRLDYFPYGHRLLLETVNAEGHPAASGQLRVSRLDHSFLIVNLRERDHAQHVTPPPDAPPGFSSPGVREPHTPQPARKVPAVTGLY